MTIPLASSDTTEGTLTQASLVFTPANWNAPQTVTVTGKDDAIADGDQPPDHRDRRHRHVQDRPAQASPRRTSFTPTNGNQAQRVTVTGVDHVLAGGDVVYPIVTAPASSADPSYNGLDPSDVTVTNTDNDAAGVTIDPTSGLLVSELGDSDTFTIVLDTQPTANVTVTLTSSDTSEGTVSPATVTATSSSRSSPARPPAPI